MSLNDTASADRIHIGFYGMRNAGKSSVVNRVTGQELSVVSDVKGTTTDPVKKAMELLPLGPVVIIDTPGLDDEGELGEKRIQRARRMLAQTDIAVLVVDAALGLSALDRELLDLFRAKKLPFVVAWNKADTLTDRPALDEASIYVSAATGENIHALKEKLGAFAKNLQTDKKVLADKLDPGSVVVLVMPIDEAAPKGRVILPQQQVLRDVLDAHCTAVCCQDTELADTLAALKEAPALVVTDSQVFGKVAKLVPTCVPLTSFSILFARYRGDLAELVRGAAKLEQLRDGDRVL
ncbi:MAG: [Oscillospiraceae bacterium]|nr:[FeFe] hydrogenase H-cluster maturation GTPase HydF [Oscillospiraceae bacterium]